MRTALLFVALSGCLIQPDTSELCFDNRVTVWDACEIETTPEEDFALQASQRDAGFAVATGCGHEVKALLECARDAGEGQACEDLAFVQAAECSFEQGRAEGCLSR